jgi:hypothetical protein
MCARARISCCFSTSQCAAAGTKQSQQPAADGKLTNWKFRMPTGKEMAGFSFDYDEDERSAVLPKGFVKEHGEVSKLKSVLLGLFCSLGYITLLSS